MRADHCRWGRVQWNHSMEVFCQQPADLTVLTSAVCAVLAVGLSLVPDWFCCVSIGRWAGFLGPRLHATKQQTLFVDVNMLWKLCFLWITAGPLVHSNEASQRVPLKHNSHSASHCFAKGTHCSGWDWTELLCRGLVAWMLHYDCKSKEKWRSTWWCCDR